MHEYKGVGLKSVSEFRVAFYYSNAVIQSIPLEPYSKVSLSWKVAALKIYTSSARHVSKGMVHVVTPLIE